MKNNINELELNILNNTTKKSIFHYIATAIYYTLKIILEAVYIITCIICTTIEIIVWMLTLGTATKTVIRRKKRRF